jgi:hypothetical protein
MAQFLTIFRPYAPHEEVKGKDDDDDEFLTR